MIASTHLRFNILCIHVLHWPALSRPSGGFLAIGLRPVFVVVVVVVVVLFVVLVLRANPMIRISPIRTGRLNFIANAHFALVCELRTCPRMARLSALAVPPPNHKGEKRMAWFNSPERPKPSQERRQTWQDARTWFQTSHESIQKETASHTKMASLTSCYQCCTCTKL